MKLERYTWSDALVNAQTADTISNGALLLALKLATAINWKPKNGRPAGLYWANDDAVKAVGSSRATLYRYLPSLIETGFFESVNGNLIPTLPKSQVETEESLLETPKSQVETQESQVETGKSQVEYTFSEDSLSEDVCSEDSYSETSVADAPAVSPLGEPDSEPFLNQENHPASFLTNEVKTKPQSQPETNRQTGREYMYRLRDQQRELELAKLGDLRGEEW